MKKIMILLLVVVTQLIVGNGDDKSTADKSASAIAKLLNHKRTELSIQNQGDETLRVTFDGLGNLKPFDVRFIKPNETDTFFIDLDREDMASKPALFIHFGITKTPTTKQNFGSTIKLSQLADFSKIKKIVVINDKIARIEL